MSNTLYKILRTNNSEEIHYIAEIDATSPIFNGHFPTQPVVPGVCTIGMIKECVEELLSKRVNFSTIKECKFLSAITPTLHSAVDVFITIKSSDESSVQVIALVKYEDKVMMKLNAIAV